MERVTRDAWRVGGATSGRPSNAGRRLHWRRASPHTCRTDATLLYSALGTERVYLPLHVGLELAEIVEELLGRFGRDLLTCLQSFTRHRQCFRAEMRELTALRLLRHLRRVDQRGLRDAIRRHAKKKRRLRRADERVRQREEAHRQTEVFAPLRAVRGTQQHVAARQRE